MGWTTWLGIGMASWALASGPRAQEAGQPVAWNHKFEVRIEGRQLETTELGAQAVQGLRDDVADLRVRVRGGITDTNIQARVDRLWAYAGAAAEVANRRAFLVDVALLRSELFETRGRIQEARGAVDELLMLSDHPFAEVQQRYFAPATAELVASAREWLSDDRLAKRRRELDQRLGGLAVAESLESMVANALAQGQHSTLQELGVHAVPTLEAIFLAGLDEFPTAIAQDALYYLVGASERRAASLCAAHLAEGPAQLRQRVLRAMRNHGVLKHDEYWRREGNGKTGAYRPTVPEWIEVLTQLLGSPQGGREALSFVGYVINHDALTPELSAALMELVRVGDGDTLRDLQDLLAQRKDSLVPVHEKLLSHTDQVLRRIAATQLARDERLNPALLSRAGDPDAGVREAVAVALTHDGTPSPEGAEVLRRLLGDDDPRVLRQLAWAAINYNALLTPEDFAILLRHRDPQTRERLAELHDARIDILSPVFGQLARDTHQGILSEVDDRLVDHDSWTRPAAYLEAAQTRLLAVENPMPSQRRGMLLQNLLVFDDGLRTAVQAALARSDDALLIEIANRESSTRTSSGIRAEAFLVLDDATLATTLVRLHAARGRMFRDLNSALANTVPPRWHVNLGLLEDTALPTALRFQAARVAARSGDPRFRRAMVSLLGHESMAQRTASDEEEELLREMLADLPPGEANGLLLDLLRDERVSRGMVEPLLYYYRPQDAGGEAVTREILARWQADPRPDYPGLSEALEHLRSLPDLATPELMRRAALESRYTAAAAETMGVLRNPEFVPILERCIRAEWMEPNSGDRSRAQYAAIRSLAAQLSDEAAQALLRAMGTTPESNIREACKTALADIRDYENEKRLWLEHTEQRVERDDAVQRLLKLLRDDNPHIRTEAARGLGTLGALETLPVLIEMLRDDDEGVRGAAQTALSRLNELGETRPLQGD